MLRLCNYKITTACDLNSIGNYKQRHYDKLECSLTRNSLLLQPISITSAPLNLHTRTVCTQFTTLTAQIAMLLRYRAALFDGTVPSRGQRSYAPTPAGQNRAALHNTCPCTSPSTLAAQTLPNHFVAAPPTRATQALRHFVEAR